LATNKGSLKFKKNEEDKGDVSLNLEKIEIHGPSEHVFGGERRDFEIQYYFNKIVVAITYEAVDNVATDEPYLAQFFTKDKDKYDVIVSPFSNLSEKKLQCPS
jgi:hypothetical protein